MPDASPAFSITTDVTDRISGSLTVGGEPEVFWTDCYSNGAGKNACERATGKCHGRSGARRPWVARYATGAFARLARVGRHESPRHRHSRTGRIRSLRIRWPRSSRVQQPSQPLAPVSWSSHAGRKSESGQGDRIGIMGCASLVLRTYQQSPAGPGPARPADGLRPLRPPAPPQPAGDR